MKHLAMPCFFFSQSVSDEADSVYNFVQQSFDVHQAGREN